MEFMIKDRLSWISFFDFDLSDAMSDENTIRHYCNRLTESGTLETLMQAFEQQLREAGYLAMGGQIVDATLAAAPKQRNTEDEKAAINAGKSTRQIWRSQPNKAHQKDVDARWTIKIGGKVRFCPDATPLPEIAALGSEFGKDAFEHAKADPADKHSLALLVQAGPAGASRQETPFQVTKMMPLINTLHRPAGCPEEREIQINSAHLPA